MKAPGQGFAASAGVYVAARVLSMAVGLATIPLLIHSLGGRGFAAWAILLSCSVVFSELQLGVHAALIREVAVADRAGPHAVSRLWASALAFLIAIYVSVLPVVAMAAEPLAEWLRLPHVGGGHPGSAVIFIYLAVSARSALSTGTQTLFASALFGRAAALSLAQAVLSNTTAALVAWLTRDLAATLVGFWSAQILVVGAGFWIARGMGWRPRLRFASLGLVRRLLAYGVKVQLAEWAQIVNFQFDKFVIVRVLGLWPAALYEVSNRSVLALRSIPSSGMNTFMPVVTQRTTNGDGAEGAARKMSLLALYAILVFFAAPLAVAPVFLYAWVGEMGYVSRHVFALLVVGAAANLLTLPLAALAQAAGRPQVQARAAGASIVLNVPLSLALVRVWGLEGAALGSSLAMVVGSAVLLREARRALGGSVVAVVTGTLRRHWPLLFVCVAWGLAVHLVFGHWFEATNVTVRYSLAKRAVAAGAALALYGACVVTLILLKLRLHGLEEDERQLLNRVAAFARIRWSHNAPALQNVAGVGAGASPPKDVA